MLVAPLGKKYWGSLPAEFWRAGADPAQGHATDLIKKAVLRSTVPLQWKGGKMVAVPKNARKPLDAVNARGVLLSPHISKMLGKSIRTVAMKFVEEALLPTQLAGRPGGPASKRCTS